MIKLSCNSFRGIKTAIMKMMFSTGKVKVRAVCKSWKTILVVRRFSSNKVHVVDSVLIRFKKLNTLLMWVFQKDECHVVGLSAFVSRNAWIWQGFVSQGERRNHHPGPQLFWGQITSSWIWGFRQNPLETRNWHRMMCFEQKSGWNIPNLENWNAW